MHFVPVILGEALPGLGVCQGFISVAWLCVFWFSASAYGSGTKTGLNKYLQIELDSVLLFQHYSGEHLHRSYISLIPSRLGGGSLCFVAFQYSLFNMLLFYLYIYAGLTVEFSPSKPLYCGRAKRRGREIRNC